MTKEEKKISWNYRAQKFIEYLLKYILYRTVQLAWFWCSQERSLTDALSCNHQLGIVKYENVKHGLQPPSGQICVLNLTRHLPFKKDSICVSCCIKCYLEEPFTYWSFQNSKTLQVFAFEVFNTGNISSRVFAMGSLIFHVVCLF